MEKKLRHYTVTKKLVGSFSEAFKCRVKFLDCVFFFLRRQIFLCEKRREN